MILQCNSDFKDEPRWKKWGCNLCIPFWYRSVLLRWKVTTEMMMDLAGEFEDNGWIDKEFAIQNYPKIYQWVGIPAESARYAPVEYKCLPNEIEHLYYERTYKGQLLGHFAAGNGFGYVTYDSYGRSNTVEFGEQVNKRIIKVDMNELGRIRGRG